MISREAGLNDTTSKCTGVPSKSIVSNTSMSSGDDLVVKGNRIAVPLERLWMSIDNENEEVN